MKIDNITLINALLCICSNGCQKNLDIGMLYIFVTVVEVAKGVTSALFEELAKLLLASVLKQLFRLNALGSMLGSMTRSCIKNVMKLRFFRKIKEFMRVFTDLNTALILTQSNFIGIILKTGYVCIWKNMLQLRFQSAFKRKSGIFNILITANTVIPRF